MPSTPSTRLTLTLTLPYLRGQAASRAAHLYAGGDSYLPLRLPIPAHDTYNNGQPEQPLTLLNYHTWGGVCGMHWHIPTPNSLTLLNYKATAAQSLALPLSLIAVATSTRQECQQKRAPTLTLCINNI